jgi:hypothetical protein
MSSYESMLLSPLPMTPGKMQPLGAMPWQRYLSQRSHDAADVATASPAKYPSSSLLNRAGAPVCELLKIQPQRVVTLFLTIGRRAKKRRNGGGRNSHNVALGEELEPLHVGRRCTQEQVHPASCSNTKNLHFRWDPDVSNTDLTLTWQGRHQLVLYYPPLMWTRTI